MRLAVCALSAVLLSGCSWLGGGSSSNSYGVNGFSSGGAYGVNCAPGQVYGAGYGNGNGAGACGPAGAYGVAGGYGAGAGFAGQGYGGQGFAGQGFAGQGFAGQGGGFGAGYGGAALAANGIGGGFGADGFGAGGAGFAGQGFGPGGFGVNGAGGGLGANGFAPNGFAGQGFAGQGFAGQGFGGNGFGAGTVLGANAPFGTNVGGNVVGTQFANGQFVQGAGVQTVQGAPVFVPQPVPAYFGVPQLRGVSAAAPFGIGLAIGTEAAIGGDLLTAKGPGIALGSDTLMTGGTDGISYADAFGQAFTVGGTAEYDVSRNTTLLGGVSYTFADGDTAEAYQSVDARSPGTFETIDATFTDLDLITVEGGVRQYVGNNPVLRPYVGAKGGFTYNDSIDVQRNYTSDGAAFDAEPLEYADSGWSPTAAAIYGVEMAVGSRASVGIESGIRWRDNFDTLGDSQDSWSIPVSLRGRMAF